MNRRIVCAALRDGDGRIVCGPRHFDGTMMEQIKDRPNKDAWRTSEQGFIDQHGKFLTREEAFVIAASERQILREVGGNGIDLYSENLY